MVHEVFKIEGGVNGVNGAADSTKELVSDMNRIAERMNESYEIARAGEAGRGFAVVADEISQLANSSREAANNIQSINNMVIKTVHELIDSSDMIVKYINDNILPDYENFVQSGKQYNDDAVHVHEIVNKFNNMSVHLRQLMQIITGSIEIASMLTDEADRFIHL